MVSGCEAQSKKINQAVKHTQYLLVDPFSADLQTDTDQSCHLMAQVTTDLPVLGCTGPIFLSLWI